MLRDFTFSRRNSGKNEELENVPVNPKDSMLTRTYSEPSRAPLNSIQEPAINPKPNQDLGVRSKIDRTPIKAKGKGSETPLPLRTPDKNGAGFSAKNRFGWAQKNELGSATDEAKADVGNYSTQLSRGSGYGNGYFPNVATPYTSRTVGRTASSYSETNSTQSTPTKSVTKPQNSVLRNKLDGNIGARPGNFTALYKGTPFHSGTPTVVNTVEVPHFDLKEDSSFWMEHNVQVLIRVRPLNSMERTSNGYNRCLKQESSQCIAWIGQPETRFTFDHVACETVDQEMLFRMAGLPMVENCLSGYNSCMFAYGQTGSGKTYTMLGEIEDLELKPSSNRGMTPRIFEFLFARIQAEEESRRDENLTYNCKCSFLEIYNEQITDLLDPSSSNLLLREDVKKGVYVENLSEFEVQTVNDILKLLTQGSLNRKVAATNMNRESSRSHSVFTCVIESRWEKDSTTNLRFARLNLVDLAGSERQKTSGAEGDRLKEAASINKSLSTLGHVIMVLVDVANGKPKHVPYRDSRLTFLLQDSLGGNSKTTIIANVSPSICCATETLNTLKFAQRAKLIQNNAIVNEDSTGDIIALQHQIQLLKEELSTLKHQNVSRSLSFGSAIIQDAAQHKNYYVENTYEMDNQLTDDITGTTSKEFVRMSTKQFKSLETTLAGALRREKMAETSIKQLEAEIELLNRLARQREEDTRSTKMMLRFREEKIQRMETLLGGYIPAETYLLEENRAQSEEIQLLQAKLDRNPEVTRFAVENIRLLDQLRRYQEFYEEGEREVLISEVSKLRDQLLQCLCGNSELHNHSITIVQPQLKNSVDELEECKRNLESCLEENEKLSREIESLRSMMSSIVGAKTEDENTVKFKKVFEDAQDENMEQCECLMVYPEEEILNLQLELDIVKILLKEEKSSRGELEERILSLNKDVELATEELHIINKQSEDQNTELIEAKSVIEALESQQIFSVNEMEELRNKNIHYLQLLSSQETEIQALKEQISVKVKELSDDSASGIQKYHAYPFQRKLRRMQDSLEKAKTLNTWYENDREFQASSEQEMDEVRRQAEAETAEVIVQMQEELAILEQQVLDGHLKEAEMKEDLIHLGSKLEQMEEKHCLMTKDNECLSKILEKKDKELITMYEEWEILTNEMEEILSEGCQAFMDATDHLDKISSSFPEKRIRISEQVHKIAKILYEKELLVDELRRCLEDANSKRYDMESMLKSLRGAAMVIAEAHQQECSEKDKEILQLTSQVNAKTSHIRKLGNKIKSAEDCVERASVCATAAFVIINRFSELSHCREDALKHKDIELNKLVEMNLGKDIICDHQACLIKETEKEMESLKDQLAELNRNCSQLARRLSEEQEHALVMEQKLQEIGNCNILMTKEKLTMLESGVSTLKSSMSSYKLYNDYSEENNSQEHCASFICKDVEQADGEAPQENNMDIKYVKDPRTILFDCSPRKEEGVPSYLFNEKYTKGSRNDYDKDMTIILLKKEIESALESLQEVQAEMGKLHGEKKEMLLNEKQSQESMQYLASQAVSLQLTMNNFEKNFEIKIKAFNNRLKNFELVLQETEFHWSNTKEVIELEVGDTKILAAHKTAEASCILAKFEEAQDTIIEADMMIRGLIIANETLKVDVERLNKERVTLINERDELSHEVQSLRFNNDLCGQQIHAIEQHVASNAEETKALIMELENIIKEVKINVNGNFVSLAYDLHATKSLLGDSMKSVHSWLENIWSEIIAKDCALSVLHLCHLGILVETVTGLNAEKSFLQHGACKSNAIVAELREHNVKSKRELDMCRVLKGKLLADLKNSFDRIQRKEEEAGQLNVKLTNFEKKISDLQFQEELMLQRSNTMGSQLAVLMKELNTCNTDVIASLLTHEKSLTDKEEFIKSQNEFFMIEWCLKDFELHIVLAELKEMTLEKADTKRENMVYQAILENFKKEVVLSKVDTELREKLLAENERDVLIIQGELQDTKIERRDLLSKLELSSLKITEMDVLNKALEQDVESLKGEVCSSDTLVVELIEVTEMKVRLLNQVESLEAQCRHLQKDYETKEENLELCSTQISSLYQDNQKLQEEICILENAINKLQSLLDLKDAELSCLEKEKESLKDELMDLETQITVVLQHLDTNKSDIDASVARIHASDRENQRLHDEVSSLETCISNLKKDLEMKNVELLELHGSQSAVMLRADSANRLKKENDLLKNEVDSYKKSHQELLKKSSFDIIKSVDSVEIKSCSAAMYGTTIFDKMSQETLENVDRLSNFIIQFEGLESHANEVIQENLSLQADLLRKDEVLKGLLFDLSLLQETASNNKDKKDEFDEIVDSMEALEDELTVKSNQLDEFIAHNHTLEVELREKRDKISALELDILNERESLKFLSNENVDLRTNIDNILEAKKSVEQESNNKKKIIEDMEMELLELCNALGQMNNLVESMCNRLNELVNERDNFQVQMLSLKEKLETTEARATECEVNLMEAQQISESTKIYAEEKMGEVKLLERSVEELECTINVLENKVDIIKEEAERQRLQREELELELHSIKYKMQSFEDADADMKRDLDEEERKIQDSLKCHKVIEQDIAEKTSEIAQLKAHISELNLHAESQANEYKQKYKALESMIEQVRPEGHSTQVINSLSNKSEKHAVKSRGSGSPFKCIGLGLTQQMKSEKDEELTAARLHIEELESLAITRQKEIFALNSRLAAAESMTHDVIRDLLGVKLDMTTYVSLLENQQVQKMTEKARINGLESEKKEQDIVKLKKQLRDFIEERQGWLEEIDRKQTEMISLQVALEKLRQRDQLLKTENEMLKMEMVNYKTRMTELEAEVKKLSGQQNLQQRIHHHAKIKEDNNRLRVQNEDLTAKLHHTEVLFSRVKEELSHIQSSTGRTSHVDFDKEQQMVLKLKETEEEKVQLAQKLQVLCTSVLKATGKTEPVSTLSPSDAAEAVEQLISRLASSNLQTKVSTDRSRLSQLIPKSSPTNSRPDDRFQSPKTEPRAPYFSVLDR